MACEAEKKKKKKIGIIGAGMSGLLACKYTLQKGFSPIVFEAQDCIGGVWSKTIESTRLQTPKSYYQFSDFQWPNSSVTDNNFPYHYQVMDYLYSYASHFNILSLIKFSSKVIAIDYCTQLEQQQEEDDNLASSWQLWGGTGLAFSPSGKWNLTVQNLRHSSIHVHKVSHLCRLHHSISSNTSFTILSNTLTF